MAQTKRKRRTKHRGTAAGAIESRGRTGRPPSPQERKKDAREQARQRRLNTPPRWNAAALKGLLAGAFMLVFLLVTSRFAIAPSVIFALIATLVYIPAGYYLELFMFKRRMRSQPRTGSSR
ncbi:MAG: hypothetical protein JOZ07_03975 [Solirubrobacterales bacterium]|nr:hypothetical protein [Solirubrobacterales bacterium]